MKKETPILQMYYGERGAHEKIQQSQRYWELLDKVVAKDEEICERLKGKQELLELYKGVLDCVSGAQSEEVASTYAEGFRFGFLMALDVMGVFS